MDCRQAIEALELQLAAPGSIEPGTAATLRSHTRGCSACAARLGVLGLVSDALAPETEVRGAGARGRRAAAVLAAIDADGADAATPIEPRPARPLVLASASPGAPGHVGRAFAAAAAIAVIVGATFLTPALPSPSPPPAPSLATVAAWHETTDAAASRGGGFPSKGYGAPSRDPLRVPRFAPMILPADWVELDAHSHEHGWVEHQIYRTATGGSVSVVYGRFAGTPPTGYQTVPLADGVERSAMCWRDGPLWFAIIADGESLEAVRRLADALAPAAAP